MGRLVGFFVRRPLLVNLLTVFAILNGIMATETMTYEVFPSIDMGVFNITTNRPGSSSADIELSITAPLEEELLKIDGLKQVTSFSMEGLSVVTVRADPDIKDKTQFISDLQKGVDRALGKLPNDLQQKPMLAETSTLNMPVMELHLSGSVPESTLRQVAHQLADALREVDGIAGVDKIGYRRAEVKILLDPSKLQRLGLNYAEIIDAIKRRNVRDSGGSLDSFIAEKSVLTVGQFSYPEEVAEVIIRGYEPGNNVRIRDIAEVVPGFEDWQVQNRVDGVNSIALLARKKGAADALKTAKAVWAFVAEANKTLPPGVNLIAVNDISRYTYEMVDMLSVNALIGFVLVFVVLLAFFHWRLSFWVSLGLPIAIAITFSLMPLFGLGVDVMTLTALILMLGMLVDDAVVTGENIQSLSEQGMSRLAAGEQGTMAMAAPVIVSSLTTILAFMPMAFLGGLEGKFMWMLPVMVGLVLVASLFECQFMLPAHLAHARVEKGQVKQWFLRVQKVYDHWIVRILYRRYRSVSIFVMLFLMIVSYGAVSLEFKLYPDVDIDTFFVKVELPEGASIDYTSQKTREVEALVRKTVPEVDLLNIVTRIGHHDTDIYGATEGRNASWALVTVYLLPQGQRKTNSNDLIRVLREKVKLLTAFRSLQVEPFKDTPVPGKPVELEIIGSGNDRFEIADIIESYLNTYPGVTEAWSSYKPGKDVITLKLDYELMASRGLAVADVTSAVRIAFDGLIVDELQTFDEKIRYRLQFQRKEKGKIETLRNLVIINQHGLPIPLRGFTDFEVDVGEAAIKHYFGKRTITLFADIDRFQITVPQINDDIAGFVEKQQLLTRFPGIRLHYGGELEQQKEAMGSMGDAFLICIITVFFIMVLLFNSIIQPFLILIVIPFGMTGVIIGFGLQGLPMSMIALVGILGLIGVLVNDSVVMIDSLNNLKKQRGDILDNLTIAAGAKRRLRPIIITSLTTVAALFPTAYGFAGSSPFITPMVMAMAWGILFGTVVSLFFLPCLYAIEQDIRQRVKQLLRFNRA